MFAMLLCGSKNKMSYTGNISTSNRLMVATRHFHTISGNKSHYFIHALTTEDNVRMFKKITFVKGRQIEAGTDPLLAVVS